MVGRVHRSIDPDRDDVRLLRSRSRIPSDPVERNDVERLKAEMEELFADLSLLPRLVGQRGGFRPERRRLPQRGPAHDRGRRQARRPRPGGTSSCPSPDGVLFVRGARSRTASTSSARQSAQIEVGGGRSAARRAAPRSGSTRTRTRPRRPQPAPDRPTDQPPPRSSIAVRMHRPERVVDRGRAAPGARNEDASAARVPGGGCCRSCHSSDTVVFPDSMAAPASRSTGGRSRTSSTKRMTNNTAGRAGGRAETPDKDAESSRGHLRRRGAQRPSTR